MDLSNAADLKAGYATYTPITLRLYDALVTLNCSKFWGCPKREVRGQYARNVAAEHLDIGVGTGYLLDHCPFPTETPRITLLDMSLNCLSHTEKRLARYDVSTCRANVLEPFPLEPDSFGSAAMSLMLHCVPGGFRTTGVAFDHAAACVRPGGKVFGSTVLSKGVPVPARTRMLLRVLNGRGIFHNTEDDLHELEAELKARFDDYTVTVRGCTALFEATVP